MPDGVTYLALVAGFGFVLIAGLRLGAGSPTILSGLFPPPAVRDWPPGVQEPDAPRFAVAHLDALRDGTVSPATPMVREEPVGTIASPQVVELYERRVGSRDMA